jgi:hypothetical protein
MFFEGGEPAITLMNHRFCSRKYKLLTDWWFGTPCTAEEWLTSALVGVSQGKMDVKESLRLMCGDKAEKYVSDTRLMLANRQGIRIVPGPLREYVDKA